MKSDSTDKKWEPVEPHPDLVEFRAEQARATQEGAYGLMAERLREATRKGERGF